MHFETQPNTKIIQLTSEIFFFEIFTKKTSKKSQLQIPVTIICQDGEIQQWLFNSSKQKYHPILKKRKQNLSNLKLIRNLCYSFGIFESIKQYNSTQEIKQKLEDISKDQNFNTPQFISILYKGRKQNKIIKFVDFLRTLATRSYTINRCPEQWRLIQEKSYLISGKSDQMFYVEGYKPSEILNFKFSFLKRTIFIQDEQISKINEQKIFSIQNDKSISKVYDQSINHRLLSMTIKMIQFLQNNFKINIKCITLKFALNKNMELLFLGIITLFIKISQKNFYSSEIRKRQIIPFNQYLQIYQRLKGLHVIYENQKRKSLQKEQNIMRKEKISIIPSNIVKQPTCQGDLCKIVLKNETEKNSQSTQKFYEISQEIIQKVRNNYISILEKLRQMNIISNYINANSQKKHVSQDERSDEQDNQKILNIRIKKVCKKCHFLYTTINKVINFDIKNKIIHHSTSVNPSGKNLLSIISNTPFKIDILKNNIIKDLKIAEKKNVTSSSTNFLAKNIDSLKKYQLNTFQIPRIRTQSTKFLMARFQQRPATTNQNQTRTNSEKIIRNKSATIIRKIPSKIKTNLQKQIQYAQPKSLTEKQISLQVAKKILINNISTMNGQSLSDLKLKYQQYCRSKNQENIEYLKSDLNFPTQYRKIYQFEKNSPIKQIDPKLIINSYPAITLQQLSQQTNYPEIVMKNNFVVDIIVCDQKTSLVYCVLTSDMFGNLPNTSYPYQNIIIVHDLFDCFLQYLQICKQILENKKNKRIILFNQPGQSHTVSDKYTSYDGIYLTELIDKLLYRLNHLNIINIEDDQFKFCGIGYGGYVLQNFLIQNYQYFKTNHILLINSYTHLQKIQIGLLRKLLEIYQSNLADSQEQPFLYYYKLIDCRVNQLNNILLLNPITLIGRINILKNIINSNVEIKNKFFNVPIKTTILHGQFNTFIPIQTTQSFIINSNESSIKAQREILMMEKCGHEMKHDQLMEFMNALDNFIS